MRKIKAFAILTFMVIGLCGLTQAARAADDRPDNVWTVIKNTKELSKFADLVSSAGAESEFKTTEMPVTVFAPSNSAVDAIPSDVMKKVKADKAKLKSLVMHHTILGSAVFTDSIRGRAASPSSGNGEMIGFDGRGKELKVGLATILTPDLGAKNGVVHVLSAPLIPFSLDEKAAEKIKEAQDASMKKMEEEMKEREAKMDAERKKMEKAAERDLPMAPLDDQAIPAPSPEAAKVAAPTDSVPSAAESSSVLATPKKDEKSGWKKLLGF
ncbi:MAG: fasciclin domain-containing protein [Alphaproteobacteria bacterium]|nr:fasciclin domain-containing protein [Alphaproteobacteria bacterium]